MSSQSSIRFQIKGLAYASLIQKIADGEPVMSTNDKEEQPTQPLSRYTTVRCLCDNASAEGNLIQCNDCNCFLHVDCLDRQSVMKSPYRCPFCQLNIDGVDPFRELTNWVEKLNLHLKSVNRLVSETIPIEQSYHMAYRYNEAYRGPQNVQQIANTFKSKLNEINRLISTIQSM